MTLDFSFCLFIELNVRSRGLILTSLLQKLFRSFSLDLVFVLHFQKGELLFCISSCNGEGFFLSLSLLFFVYKVLTVYKGVTFKDDPRVVLLIFS